MKRVRIIHFMIAAMLLVNTAQAADNVHFSGALVSEPCSIPDSDTDIHVDFGSVIIKYLYQYQHTKSELFTIHLENCDPSVMKTVSVTFEGIADDELTDMLALDASASARGVAIGLETSNGTSLVINKSSPFTQLTNGNNELTFSAYIQAKPTEIANSSLTPGNISAVSTFMLNYQ
ncbi:type 1 fimbrial protein [Enterobacter asburiae]|uniref:fimbrial protein n=1 Tax=Enterobacter TaxID=547 RepID=UPI0009B1E11D|nr:MULTISPECIES: fimbrial protein [Enterobacter]MCG7801610.1 type 1 fimbrial protein [Enterobacter asburiae]MCK6836465.1 type 1 fimbrial protein [Enterobacter asburiae]MCK6994177.1 type 1 fimbrial protein [Enterobacter asburiae]MDV5191641.1 fimbrial protein [Enterobacter asburiae]MDV5267843.1 fimbrial protein [Enterobacter asburiae]